MAFTPFKKQLLADDDRTVYGLENGLQIWNAARYSIKKRDITQK